MALIYWHHEQLPDGAGAMCRAIVFELVPMEAVPRTGEASLTGPPLEELRAQALEKATEGRPALPARTLHRYSSAAISLYAGARARGRCEACGKKAPFRRRDGVPFLEVYHIRRLADYGPDDPLFVAAICPNCHRRIHHGADGEAVNDTLGRAIRLREEAMGGVAVANADDHLA